MIAPELKFFAELCVTVDAPIEVGQTPRGMRRLIPITGGTVKGDGWTGRVVPGGADFQVIVSDRMAELDARYIIESEAGDRIFIENRAVRVASPEIIAKLVKGHAVDPSLVYFRCTPKLETSSSTFQWVNETIFIGTARRRPNHVELTFFSVL